MSTVLANTITGVTGGGTTLKVANDTTFISDGGATTNTNLVQGLCKAWTNSDSDASRNDSFNIDGETDHGTGTYSYDLINHMSATNSYAQSGIARGTGDGRIITRNTSRNTAGVVAVECSTDDGTLTDMHHDIFIVGDLA